MAPTNATNPSSKNSGGASLWLQSERQIPQARTQVVQVCGFNPSDKSLKQELRWCQVCSINQRDKPLKQELRWCQVSGINQRDKSLKQELRWCMSVASTRATNPSRKNSGGASLWLQPERQIPQAITQVVPSLWLQPARQIPQARTQVVPSL